MQRKAELYKTAQATIACALFGAGAFVTVAHYGQINGIDWYMCRPAGSTTGAVYPAHHLARFTL